MLYNVERPKIKQGLWGEQKGSVSGLRRWFGWLLLCRRSQVLQLSRRWGRCSLNMRVFYQEDGDGWSLSMRVFLLHHHPGWMSSQRWLWSTLFSWENTTGLVKKKPKHIKFFNPSCIDEGHHRIVGQLSRLHRDWSGERLYQVSS